jgi:type IV pilus modification protein PilV
MSKEKGFTLIEVLIAITILAIAITALAGLAGSSMKSTDTGKRRTQAVNLAMESLESLKAVPYYNIQSTGNDGGVTRTCSALTGTPPTATCVPSPGAVTIGNMQFSWTWKVTYVDLNNNGAYYSVAPIIETTDMKRIDITVTWTDLFGSHTITIPTLRKT